MSKVAIVVLSDTKTEEGLGRMYNALTTVKELRDAGDEVKLFFDGTGTRWVNELSNPEHIAHSLYFEVKDRVAGACSGCSSVFGSTEGVENGGIELIQEFDGQVAYQPHIADGYQIITF